ncbi:hypothetical protein SADUNF_Sadunf06G0141200 [Salix dunnii]|uniref:RING-type domain-containing protein n=1 Tax=Salix dunnii TaxID=1413687 RepID=A0A835K777_9ROSI|nr:hypothetical protein SADUNF_Sadunf06G0141200 [Salix dunnii]
MDITHDVRTCTANMNCDCEPSGLLLGVNSVTKARYVKRYSQKCLEICGTASKYFRGRDSTFPVENQGKLYRISSEATTPDEHGLQNENRKAAGTSQTESTSDSVAAMAKTNGLKVQSGKSGRAQPHQLTQNSRYSAKAADDNGYLMQPVKKSGDKLPPTSGQDMGVKAKIVPLKYSSISSSSAWQVKEKKETSKEPSNLSSNMRSSDQVHSGQPTQKRECSAGSVKKSGNQIHPTSWKEKDKKEPSKGPFNSSTKMIPSDRVRRGNQLPAIPKQVWQVKGKIASSQDSGKTSSQDSGETSSKVCQVKKKTPALSSKMCLSHAEQRRPHQRSFSPEHYTKRDGFVKLGHECFLCENDLALSPLPIDEESELESDKLPDVAVLPCGHTFHTMCLQQAVPEDHLKDPPCFICASLQ